MQRLLWLPIVVAVVALGLAVWLLAPSEPPRRPAPTPAAAPRAKNPVADVVERVSRSPPPLLPERSSDVRGAAVPTSSPFARRWLARWSQALGPTFELLPRSADEAQVLSRATPSGALPPSSAPAFDGPRTCAPGPFTVPLAATRADVLAVVDTAAVAFTSLEPSLGFVRRLSESLGDAGVDAQLLVLAQADALRTFAPVGDDDGVGVAPSSAGGHDLLEVVLDALSATSPWAASLRADTPLHLVLLSAGDAVSFGRTAGLRAAELRTADGRAEHFLQKLKASLQRLAVRPPSITVHVLVGAELGSAVQLPEQPVVTARCATTAGETYQSLAVRSAGLRGSLCPSADGFEAFTQALVERLRQPTALDEERVLADWPTFVTSLEAVGAATGQKEPLVQTGGCGRGPPHVWRWDGAHDHLCAGAASQLLGEGYVAVQGERGCAATP